MTSPNRQSKLSVIDPRRMEDSVKKFQNSLRNLDTGPREMVPWYRTLVALAEDLASVPSTHMVALNYP